MNHLWPDQAPYTVCNSSLSEYGVLGGSNSAGGSGRPGIPKRGLHPEVPCHCDHRRGLWLRGQDRVWVQEGLRRSGPWGGPESWHSHGDDAWTIPA